MLTIELNGSKGGGVPEQRRLLIVEDETVFLKLLRMILEDEGFEVHTAENGRAGIELAHELHPDLIVMDINMPVMNGFQAADQLQKDDTLKQIPILFLSAQQDISSKARGFELGAVDYMVKPFDPTELVTRINSRLNKRRLERRAQSHARVETLSQLMVTLAHYLNNSVSVISGSIELLQDEPVDKRDLREARRTITRETAQIKAVIEGLQDMAKSEDIRTMDYLGTKDAMLDISRTIEARLKEMQKEYNLAKGQ